MKLMDSVSFVKRGKNRKKVFKALDKPMIPSEIVKKVFGKSSNSYFNVVSRALSELKDKDLVEVVNPKEKTGRIYKKTNTGKKLEKKLELLD